MNATRKLKALEFLRSYSRGELVYSYLNIDLAMMQFASTVRGKENAETHSTPPVNVIPLAHIMFTARSAR